MCPFQTSIRVVSPSQKVDVEIQVELDPSMVVRNLNLEEQGFAASYQVTLFCLLISLFFLSFSAGNAAHGGLL